MREAPITVGERQRDAIVRAGVLGDGLAERLRAALAEWPDLRPGPPRPLPPTGADIRPGCAGVVRLAPGERLVIAQTTGCTCVDVVAWGADDPAERLSAAHSRPTCGASPTAGAVLVSGPPWERALLVIAEDTAPGHDLLFPACSPGEFAAIGSAPEPSCRALHELAATACGASPQSAPDPLNLWFRSWTDGDGALRWERTPTAPGDAVVLEAAAACRVAVNPCVSDVFGCSPFGAGSIRLAVEGRADAVEIIGAPAPPPSAVLRVALPDDLAAELAARAEPLGADAESLCRALLLRLAVDALGAPQAGGR